VPQPPVLTPNSYSIQNNTNTFPCTNCPSVFPATPNIKNSAGKSGDTAWMQFVYQSGNPPLVCVWYVDSTVAGNTNSQAGYLSKCVPGTQQGGAPLLGPGSPAVWMAAVFAYDSCSSSSGSNCQISIWAYDGTQPADWYGITSPLGDALGLSGNWTDVSGTILGQGGGSKAVFQNVYLFTGLQAYSCNTVPITYLTGSPPACPKPAQPTASDLLSDLNGIATVTSFTGETNNLNNEPFYFGCGPSGDPIQCELAYYSSAP
jgi:hypothetical protein